MCAPKKKPCVSCSTFTSAPSGTPFSANAPSALRYFSMSASMRFWTSSFQIFQYASDITERLILNSACTATAASAATAMIFFFMVVPLIGGTLV